MRRSHCLALLAVTVAMPMATARAQSPATDGGGAAAVRSVARRRPSPIVIDGRLDDAAWATATPITALRQYKPTEGAPASLPTEVRILFDDRAIYIGARMSDSLGRAGVRAPRARRARAATSCSTATATTAHSTR